MIKATVAAAALGASLFQLPSLTYSTPSTSMAPALTPGDVLLFPALFGGEPKRGDVVVFRVADGAGRATAYVKRVIGLPGETVQYVAGAPRIDGVDVARAEIALPAGLAPELASAKAYRESFGDAAYDVIEAVDDGFLDDTQPYAVPAGAYFTLGDNRDNSADSRVEHVGVARADAIVGRVCLVWRFPFSFRNICRAPEPVASRL